MTRRTKKIAMVALVGLVWRAAPSADGQTSVAAGVPIGMSSTCADRTKFRVSGVTMVISKTEWFPAGTVVAQEQNPQQPSQATPLPPFCRLDGVIDQRIGADGLSYGIGFALALPDDWNGRFLFQGGGGFNGRVSPPLGRVASGNVTALARGFAVVSTDTGHQATRIFDGTFLKDQQATLDFAYIAVGRVAALAKQLVAQYYGRPAEHSYFVGCSTGGREGMLMTQRYPLYFDGVVSGDPAMRIGVSALAQRSRDIALNQIAPRDPAGKPMRDRAFSESDTRLVISALLDACDLKDGLKDEMIFNPQACNFDPVVLMCKGEKTEACLTSPQITTLKKVFAGPKDSKGNQVYPGFFYDPGVVPEFLRSDPWDSGQGLLEQDVDREAAAEVNPLAAMRDTAGWTNLNTFSAHGGKLILYHGVSDPSFSAKDTIQYYESMVKDNGGLDQVQRWSRLFLVPSMGHCRGGPLDEFDLLGAVVDWVEKGMVPDSVIVTKRPFTNRSRPLCAYPKHAHYTGQGDPEDAKSFECRE